jgi:hypothetical protein
VSASDNLLRQATALRSAAAIKAAEVASRSSTTLSRLVFLGLLALPLLQPKGSDSVQTSAAELQENIEIVRTRRVPAPPASAPLSSSEAEAVAEAPPPAQPPAAAAVETKSPTEAKSETKSDPKSDQATTAPAATEPPKAADGAKPAEPAAPIPPSQQKTPDWTSAEIAAANKDCDRLLDKVKIVADVVPPTREGACGAPAARLVKTLGQSKVDFRPAATLNCPMVAALNTWLADKLQPAAKKSFGSPVVRILTAASYDCRNRYGLAKAPISEHAFMNAIDVSGFVLENGKTVKVADAWSAPARDPKASSADGPEVPPVKRAKVSTASLSKLGAHDVAVTAKASDKAAKTPSSPADDAATKNAATASAFLHEVHDEACDIFGTVLGPEANAAHHDHFHLDMKARKHRAICE